MRPCSSPVKPTVSRALPLLLLTLGCGAEQTSDETALPAVSLTQPLMYGNHDYLFIRTTRTWAQAGALCDSLGYGLVTVNDVQEEAFLHRFDRGSVWWLGVNDIQTEGRWVWRDGTSSYLPWAQGEPNNYGGDEDCAAANYFPGVLSAWVDSPCSAKFHVVCESRE
jgi:hypothetical protein